MSLFAGLDKAKVGNSNFDKADYFVHGSYIWLLGETDVFANRDGQLCLSAEGTVLSSQTVPVSAKCALEDNFKRDSQGAPYIIPVPVGRKVRFFWTLSRNRKDELDFRGINDMNRLKGFLSAVLGGDVLGVTGDAITEDVAMSIMFGTSRLAQRGDTKALADRIKKDFKMDLPEGLINLSGQVLGVESRYTEYTPKQGKNEGKLTGSTESTIRALPESEVALWTKKA